MYYYLHKKLDDNYDIIGILEEKVNEQTNIAKQVEEKYKAELEEHTSTNKEMIADLLEKLSTSEERLKNLREFQQKKTEMELHLKTLENELESIKKGHEEETTELERKSVREKERLKREMLMKIKETKQNLLSMTENQLHNTTKRTIMENEQMISELQYQSKESEKLLIKNKVLEEEKIHQRLELQLHSDMEKKYAKRTHYYQQVIKKLEEKIAEYETHEHYTANTALEELTTELADCRLKLETLRCDNERLSESVETEKKAKSELKRLCEQSRVEKKKLLQFQDESVNFLLTTLKESSPSSTSLDEMTFSERQKTLEFFLQKLQVYQRRVKNAGLVEQRNRSELAQHFRLALPSVNSATTGSNSTNRTTPIVFPSSHMCSVGVQTMNPNLVMTSFKNCNSNRLQLIKKSTNKSPSKQRWDQGNAVRLKQQQQR